MAHNVSPNIMQICGEFKVRAINDMAQFSVSVTSRHKKSKEARKENNEKMQNVFSILEQSGVEKKYYQTSGFKISKWLERVEVKKKSAKHWENVELGWEVRNGVDVTLKNIDAIGDIYDGLADAGVTGLSNPVFHVNNPGELMDSARIGAMENALAKAHIYAKVAGVRILSLFQFSERAESYGESDNAGVTRAMSFSPESSESADGAPITGGSQQLKVIVTCQFTISDFKKDGLFSRKSAKKSK